MVTDIDKLPATQYPGHPVRRRSARPAWPVVCGPRDSLHAKAVTQGWVGERPDGGGTYRLTGLGGQVLAEVAARSAPVTVRQREAI